MRRRLFAASVLAAASLALSATPAAAAVPAWTTYRHDAARSGIDPDSTSPVAPAQTWQTRPLDGEVYAQPLIYGQTVYVATENDTIYALDAASGAVVWKTHLATPEPSSQAPCGDINPSIGITGTPVIDPSTGRIYAVGAVSTSGTIHHELFALDITSGQPVTGFPVAVDPPFPSGGTPVNQLQRAGLALDAGRILIGFGGNDGDCNTYWGWLVSAPTDGSTSLSSFQVDSHYHEGALWAAGNAPLVDAAGNVYVATGNGSGDSSTNPDYGDSVVKLTALASPLDWWAPTNWQSLDSGDADLGSSMPSLLPGGFLFQSGKDGNGYVLNAAHLGNVSAPVAKASGFCSGGSFGGAIYDPSSSAIYAACSAGLQALTFSGGSSPAVAAKAGFTAPAHASGPPMLAAGLVWVTNPGGTLYGVDPATGAVSSHFSIPEKTVSGGSDVNHFASPSAAGGRLFVASGDQVTAFTIAQTPGATPTTTTLSASGNPVATGQNVTLTATVAPAPDAGTVTFTDGGAPIGGCAALPLAAATPGQVVCTTSFSGSGTHSIIASYSGDTYFDASTSSALHESVTATGPGGHGAAPTLSRASIKPRRFTARHGARVTVTVSQAATIEIVVIRLRHGRLAGRRCLVARHHGRRCRTRVMVRRLHLRAHGGTATFKHRLRGLAAGHYSALIDAVNRFGHSRVIRISFTIFRPRPRHRHRLH